MPGGRRPTGRGLEDRGGKEPPKKIPVRIQKARADSKEQEAHRVYLWRKEQLELAGMPKELAKSCAADESIDLHVACDMLASGCSPESVPEMLSAL